MFSSNYFGVSHAEEKSGLSKKDYFHCFDDQIEGDKINRKFQDYLNYVTSISIEIKFAV